MGLIYRPLLFASLDEDVAEAKGMPMLFLGIVFMLLVALSVSFAGQVTGVLLIFSLMVTPAAISSGPLEETLVGHFALGYNRCPGVDRAFHRLFHSFPSQLFHNRDCLRALLDSPRNEDAIETQKDNRACHGNNMIGS